MQSAERRMQNERLARKRFVRNLKRHNSDFVVTVELADKCKACKDFKCLKRRARKKTNAEIIGRRVYRELFNKRV